MLHLEVAIPESDPDEDSLTIFTAKSETLRTIFFLTHSEQKFTTKVFNKYQNILGHLGLFMAKFEETKIFPENLTFNF